MEKFAAQSERCALAGCLPGSAKMLNVVQKVTSARGAEGSGFAIAVGCVQSFGLMGCGKYDDSQFYLIG